LKYIDEHREEVEREWAAIQERHRIGRIHSEIRLAKIRAEKGPPRHPMWEKLQRMIAESEIRRIVEARVEADDPVFVSRLRPPG
jgi:hypothetical protein